MDNSESQPRLDVAAIHAATQGLRLGAPLLYFPAIGSTNTHVMELAREGAAEGLLVMTDEQTAGRGRIGRAWKSLPGRQLECSLLLRPTAFPPHFLVMASAVAVAESIEAVADVQAGIKWPNDVQVDGRKVCGILIETTSDFVVLGIGLNVNGTLADDPALAALATTLADACGRTLSREALAIELLQRLDARYADLCANGTAAREALRAAWRGRLVTLGRRVTLLQGEASISGVAEDVDESGALLLRRNDGTRQTVTWGDVSS
jgi:BirA family biotin operon repressor/biotin-[acetyl-CoA-carboxylase] ligase